MFITDEIDPGALYYPPFEKAAEENPLFFDIETSGLSFDRSHITVIGAAAIQSGKIRFFQWFADVPGSEPYILADFLDFAGSYKKIVSYNGLGFDVPYINRRAAFLSIPSRLGEMEHLDLFRYSKPFARLFALPDRKLKTIEKGLFIERKDRCSGADCVDLYRAYLQTGDTGLRDLILLHNREDIVDLIDVMHIMAYHELKCGGFSVEEVSQKDMTVRCSLFAPLPRAFETGSEQYKISASDASMLVSFTGSACTKKLFRRDYRNYYYLKNEDMAIHKSVGQFVSRANREQAKASNCYEKTESVFFAQPGEYILPSFRDEYKSRQYFFRAEDVTGDPETVHSLCMSVIRELIP